MKCRWPGEVTGEAGISAGMGAFVRDSHSAETAGRNAALSTVDLAQLAHNSKVSD